MNTSTFKAVLLVGLAAFGWAHPAKADVVTDWNQTAINAVVASGAGAEPYRHARWQSCMQQSMMPSTPLIAGIPCMRLMSRHRQEPRERPQRPQRRMVF